MLLVLEREGSIVPRQHLDPLWTVGLAKRHVFRYEVGPAEHVQEVDTWESGSVVSVSLGDETAEDFNQAVVSPLAVGE